jgi:RND family efflux transporter MFP subunit
MRKKIKWIIIGVILIGISAALYTASRPAAVVDPGAGSQAITFQVTREALINKVEIKGKSLYEQETLVYAPFGSKVTEWIVQEGQQVSEGDVLFKLDRSSLENEITQQEASIKKARLEAGLTEYTSQLNEEMPGIGATEAEKGKALAARESMRLTKELNEVTASIQEKELAEKRSRLQLADFKAPATGIFLYDSTNKRVHAVTDNQYIGKIVDLDKLQLMALVGEQDVFRIKPGMHVEVKMNAMKQVKLSGKVLKVSKFAKSGTDNTSLDKVAQFEVIIALEPNEYLIAGLSLSGEIETARKENALVVPTMAVIREQDSYYVMLDKGNGQTERQPVKIGMETSEKTEVLEGLKEGDVVTLP